MVVGKRDHIEIFGNDYNTADGTAIRDYIHVSDLADIHLEVAKYLLENSESVSYTHLTLPTKRIV